MNDYILWRAFLKTKMFTSHLSVFFIYCIFVEQFEDLKTTTLQLSKTLTLHLKTTDSSSKDKRHSTQREVDVDEIYIQHCSNLL